MLVLSRKKNESIIIDGCIRVTVVDTGNNTVRIGIEAPREMMILRSELKNDSTQPETVAQSQPTTIASAVEFPVEIHETLREVAI